MLHFKAHPLRETPLKTSRANGTVSATFTLCLLASLACLGQARAAERCTDFSGVSSGDKVPSKFTQDGFSFVFKNKPRATDGGLYFDPSGVSISFLDPASRGLITIQGSGTKTKTQAMDADGVVLDKADSGHRTGILVLKTADAGGSIRKLRLTGGGYEGEIIGVCVE